MNYFTNNSTVKSSRIIHTPSAFARSSLLYLQETGTLRAVRVHRSSRSGLVSYLFFMVEDGSGELEYDGTLYHLKQGDCVFIDCRRPYSHSTSQDLWSLKWVHFYGPNMNAVYEKYRSRGGRPVFHPEQIESYRQNLQELYEAAGSDSYVRDMVINQKLSSLLVLLMEDSWNPEITEQGGKRGQVQEIKEYLDRNYKEKLSLEKLADHFFMNKTYLAEIFKEHYGVPVNEYLISVRITKSKELLRFTDKTMDEIADEIGVNGAAYFSRLFKKVEGVSPREYRRMW